MGAKAIAVVAEEAMAGACEHGSEAYLVNHGSEPYLVNRFHPRPGLTAARWLASWILQEEGIYTTLFPDPAASWPCCRRLIHGWQIGSSSCSRGRERNRVGSVVPWFHFLARFAPAASSSSFPARRAARSCRHGQEAAHLYYVFKPVATPPDLLSRSCTSFDLLLEPVVV